MVGPAGTETKPQELREKSSAEALSRDSIPSRPGSGHASLVWAGPPAYRLLKSSQVERQFVTSSSPCSEALRSERKHMAAEWAYRKPRILCACLFGRVVGVDCVCAWIELRVAECLSCADLDTYKHRIFGHLISTPDRTRKCRSGSKSGNFLVNRLNLRNLYGVVGRAITLSNSRPQ